FIITHLLIEDEDYADIYTLLGDTLVVTLKAIFHIEDFQYDKEIELAKKYINLEEWYKDYNLHR
ncbi:MAG: hypothetical protein LUG46_04715, partial [Erysipelotrichaceae bacterium]|nr:hypothetical protein [Erysipelotrichaceae bacterium]